MQDPYEGVFDVNTDMDVLMAYKAMRSPRDLRLGDDNVSYKPTISQVHQYHVDQSYEPYRHQLALPPPPEPPDFGIWKDDDGTMETNYHHLPCKHPYTVLNGIS